MSCSLLWLHFVWVQANHMNSYGLVTCILFIIVALFCMNAAKPYEFIRFCDMYPVHYCGLIQCECSQTIGNHMFLLTCILFIIVVLFCVNAAKTLEFTWFGDTYPAHCGLAWCACSQTISMHMVRWHVSCLVLLPYLVWMQPKHRNSYVSVTWIMLIIVALICVNATKPKEFICLGDMNHVYYCGLDLCKCSQAIGIHKVCWHVSCLLLLPYLPWL